MAAKVNKFSETAKKKSKKHIQKNVLLHIGYETGQDNYAFKCQTDNVC